MNIALLYPVPNETPEVWEMFKPFLERFCRTLMEHDPGEKYKLYAICSGQHAMPEIWDCLNGLNAGTDFYNGGGFDIGACQWIGRQLDSDTFTINFTTRCYFHRPYWLTAYRTYRERWGSVILGASASKEGGQHHICTRAYAMDAWVWKLYPHTITSRDQGVFFECGDGSLTTWADSFGVGCVTCGFHQAHIGAYAAEDWINHFRRGDQSDMLVHDRHTDLWRDADPAEKERLTNLMLGVDLAAKAA